MDFTSAISHSSSRPLQTEIYIPPVRACDLRREPSIDVRKYGFKDFDLDLACLTPPSKTISLPSSPRSPMRPPFIHVESGSSLTTQQLQQQSIDHQKRTSLVLPTPSFHHSPSRPTRAMTIARSSMPFISDQIDGSGRGTPPDLSRRTQWGGAHTVSGHIDSSPLCGVAEDGLLLLGGTGVRASSLDGPFHLFGNMTGIGARGGSVTPPNHGQRSPSPGTNQDLDNIIQIGLGLVPGPPRSYISPMTEMAPLPESSKIQYQSSEDPTEWARFMETVLGSARPEPSTSASTANGDRMDVDVTPNADADDSKTVSLSPLLLGVNGLRDHEMEELDKALDIGFGVGVGLPRSSTMDTKDSLSVYSTPPASPRQSQSQSRFSEARSHSRSSSCTATQTATPTLTTAPSPATLATQKDPVSPSVVGLTPLMLSRSVRRPSANAPLGKRKSRELNAALSKDTQVGDHWWKRFVRNLTLRRLRGSTRSRM